MFRKMIIFTLFLILTNIGMAISGTVQLPQTGQTTCYNSSGTVIPCAGTGQDGDLKAGVTWPIPRFTVSGECIADMLTGLMWARNGSPSTASNFQTALDYIASLNSGPGLCGHQDWRLPNVNELESLANAGQPDTSVWLKTQGFGDVYSQEYWSSTGRFFHPTDAWSVGLWQGNVWRRDKTSGLNVLPVRSDQSLGQPALLWQTGQTTCYDMTGTVIPCAGTGQDGDLKAGVTWPIPRFTVSGECITDKLTGLMWTRNANLPNGSRSWQGALDYVTSLNNGSGLCGHHDWRLPNRKELWSLIDHSNNPALPTGNPFINVIPDRYWSSTTLGANAWYVDLWEGYTEIYHRNAGNSVWPVRFGQSAVFNHFIYLPIIMR